MFSLKNPSFPRPSEKVSLVSSFNILTSNVHHLQPSSVRIHRSYYEMKQDALENDQPWSLEIAKKHIAAARGGSTKKLKFLATNFLQVPSEALVEAADLFLPAFVVPDGFDPLEPLPSSLKPRYRLVEICLHGLVSFGVRLRDNFSFKKKFASSWPNILKWAHYYFIDNCTGSPSVTKIREGELHALGQLSKLFVVFSSLEKGYSNPNERVATFALLTKVWLKMVPNTELDAITPRDEIMGQMCSALASAVSSPSWSLSSAVEVLLREAGNQASVVAKVALTALRDAPNFQTDADSMKLIDKSVLAVCYLLSLDVREGHSSIVLQAFVDQRVVKIITRTFWHFSTRTLSTLDNPLSIPYTCINIIKAFLDSRLAFVLAPQILRYGFLEGLADHVGYFYPVGKAYPRLVLQNIIGVLLPALLVFYPVISSAIQATNTLIVTEKIKKISTGIASTEWAFFFDTLLERATVKAHYDLYLKTDSHLYCHNCGLSSNQVGQKVLACSGCKMALYCSSNCQKEAWNSASHNHKLECGTLGEISMGSAFIRHSFFRSSLRTT
ncbi:hypothetical protein SCHPADRAFT_162011 [Schizopora paradoxa]|uniref:MYND-type domain-containing protein n=1 Tax=Schizopora paradoxa TaxID=27342 RepID=A0A0H2S7H3_9AGAM|nr:hypothetical protein SCHPADRAFT_162011 [Schizopora paradoxa]